MSRVPLSGRAISAGSAGALLRWPLVIRDALVWVVAAAAVVVLLLWPQITNYYSYQSSYYVALLSAAGVTAVLVVSLNIAMGYTGMLSILHTGLLALGGYTAGVTISKAHWSGWLGLVLAPVVAAAVSAVVVLVSLRATDLYFGMITLAADLVVVEVARQWTSVTGGDLGLYNLDPPSLGSAPLSINGVYYLVLIAVAFAYIFQRNLVRSGTGRSWMAVRESDDTAAALGIRPATTKLVAFILSGALAGLAGGLYAFEAGAIAPSTGTLDNGLTLFVGLLLGGIGTLVGPLLGVAAVVVLQQLLKGHPDTATLWLGVVLLVAMIVVPRGLVGSWRAGRLGREGFESDPEKPTVTEVPRSAVRHSAETVSQAPLLEARGVHRSFGGVRALQGVDLTVRGGRVHGVIGPNGSGKSTLVSCLTAFTSIDAGGVLLEGRPLPSRPDQVAAAGVTRVFQVPHLFDRVSVLDNVLAGMHLNERQTWVSALVRTPGYRREDRREREEAQELLAFAGLGGRERWPASALSHGQKRLLEVVRAVASRPRGLILDEPATGLTGSEVDALARLVRTLRDAGLAVVLIEHNTAFVLDVCDVVTVLDGGRVIAEGPPAHVQKSPAVLEAYLGPGSTATVEQPA